MDYRLLQQKRVCIMEYGCLPEDKEDVIDLANMTSGKLILLEVAPMKANDVLR